MRLPAEIPYIQPGQPSPPSLYNTSSNNRDMMGTSFTTRRYTEQIRPVRDGGWTTSQQTRVRPFSSPEKLVVGDVNKEVRRIVEFGSYEFLQRQFCLAHVLHAFHDLGLVYHLSGDQPVPLSTLLEYMNIGKKYHPLVQHLLHQLEMEGYVKETTDGQWKLGRVSFPEETWIREQIERIEKEVADSQSENNGPGTEWVTFLQLCGKCAASLPRILTGEQDPGPLLFPEGASGADDLYAKLPEVDARDQVLEVILKSMDFVGNEKPRVLEISSGRDTSTSSRLVSIIGESAEYIVTKPSNAYLRKLSGTGLLPPDSLATHSLNIEYDPKAQGFTPHSFDVLVAINCLHTVRNPETALRHIRQLLRYGGTLLLCERTSPSLGLDLTFGLQSNWWRRFQMDSRDYILQSMETWAKHLEAAGFDLNARYESAESIIIASLRESATSQPEPPLSSKPWVIIGNEPSLQTRLEKLLGIGDGVVLKELGEQSVYAGIVYICVDGDFSALANIRPRQLHVDTKILLVTLGTYDRSLFAALAAAENSDNPSLAQTLAELTASHALLGGVNFTLIEVEDIDPTSPGLDLQIFQEIWRTPNRPHVLIKGCRVYEPEFALDDESSDPSNKEECSMTDSPSTPIDFVLLQEGHEASDSDDGHADDGASCDEADDNDNAGAVLDFLRGLPEVIKAKVTQCTELVEISSLDEIGKTGTETSSTSTLCTVKLQPDTELAELMATICRVHIRSPNRDLRLLVTSDGPDRAALTWLCPTLSQWRARHGMRGACVLLSSNYITNGDKPPDLRSFITPQPIPQESVVRLFDLGPLYSSGTDAGGLEGAMMSPTSPGLDTSSLGGYGSSGPGSVASGGGKKRSSSCAAMLLSGKSQEEQLSIICEVVLDALSHVSGLAVTEIDDTQGFQEMGLDSLMILHLVNRLESAFQMELQVTSIFDQPTPTQLVAFLQETLDGAGRQGSRRQSSFVLFEEDIAIIGAAVRVGDALNLKEFWNLLLEGRDCITEIPNSRFDWRPLEERGLIYNHYGSFVRNVDLFDCDFFQVSPNEAALVDPQHRLLLQTSWEALEHAGLPPDTLEGTKTGVFVGLCNQDYRDIVSVPEGASGSYCVTSNLQSVASGRISYFLGLQGPSVVVDTACSSSLVALHMACSSLIQDDSKLALVGGVNLILSPNMYLSYSRAHMLSHGRPCRPFDDSADGLVRGEGCGVVVLKKLADAWTDGDNVLAVIRGSGVNQDGASAGLTAPNGTAQAQLIRRTLKKANLTALDIGFMEAHGTGTALGDPIEVNALETIFGEIGRPGAGRPPLFVGSVKANVGHTEGAAGIIGLLKLCLALKNSRIPPQINVDHLNSHIANPNFFQLARAPGGARWDRNKIGCVSSFGVSGTNAFAIVEEAPDYSRLAYFARNSTTPYLITVSAKNATALKQLLVNFRERIANEVKLEEFGRIAFTSNVGRTHFRYRAAIVATCPEDFVKQIDEETAGNNPEGFLRSTTAPRQTICFLFTGQGSHYKKMGAELYASHPHFREVFDTVARQVEDATGQFLADLFEEDGDDGGGDVILNDFVLSQAALFALEYALASYWIQLGLTPSYVLGHSLGEYVAAAVAGVLSMQDALMLLLMRANLIRDGLRPGEWGMLALSRETWTAVEKKWAEKKVRLACDNSSKQIVVAGPVNELNNLRTETGTGVLLSVQYGFHSSQLTSIVPTFRSEVSKLKYSKPKIDFVSSVTGGVVSSVNHQHWIDHLVKPVRFCEAFHHVHEVLGCNTFLEIGPKRVLTTFGQHMAGSDAEFLCSIRPGEPNLVSVVKTLAKLYVLGFGIRFKEFYTDRIMKIDLPSYPFDLKRYWSTREIQFGAANQEDAGSEVRQQPSEPLVDPLIGRRICRTRTSVIFEREQRVEDADLIDEQTLLAMAHTALKETINEDKRLKKFKCDREAFHHATPPAIIQTVVNVVEKNLEISCEKDEEWYILATGEFDTPSPEIQACKPGAEGSDGRPPPGTPTATTSSRKQSAKCSSSQSADFQPIQKELIRMLSRITGFQRIAPNARLKSLGLEAVMLEQLQTEIKNTFQVDMVPSVNLSVTSLAKRVIAAQQEQRDGIVVTTAAGNTTTTSTRRVKLAQGSSPAAMEPLERGRRQLRSPAPSPPLSPSILRPTKYGPRPPKNYGNNLTNRSSYTNCISPSAAAPHQTDKEQSRAHTKANAPAGTSRLPMRRTVSVEVELHDEEQAKSKTMSSEHDTPKMVNGQMELPNALMPANNNNTKTPIPSDVAIVGVACKIGPCNSAEELWTLLSKAKSSVSHAPPSRTEIHTYCEAHDKPAPVCSWLTDLDQFDASFFNLSRKEADMMDPQQRLLLQLSWHALESAGVAPTSLRDSSTGVFVGISRNTDYKRMVDSWRNGQGLPRLQSSYSAAGRIGSVLGVRGICLDVDTACSSGLVALHLAVNALRSGEIDLAVVGAANVALAPEDFEAYARARQTSPDGITRAFDESASGFVRGEAVVVLVLKRQDKVHASRCTRVRALIKGSSVVNVGHGSQEGQAAMIQAALKNADLEPQHLDYVEMHGTGVRDALEVNAFQAACGPLRLYPVYLGSIKPNVGHTEAASGLVSVVKLLMAMDAGRLPEQINFQKLHPEIKNPNFCGLVLQSGGIPWPGKENCSRVASVTALGGPGASAHAILQSVSKSELKRTNDLAQLVVPAPYLFLISAKSETSLHKLCREYESLPEQNLADLAYSMTVSRAHFRENRMAIVASTHSGLVEQLREMKLTSPHEDQSPHPQFSFFFGDNVKFPLEIYEQIPLFAKHYREVADISARFDVVVAEYLTSERPSIIKTFASQYILAAGLLDLGITPEYVGGVATGELVCSVITKLLALPDVLRLVLLRSRDKIKRVSFGPLTTRTDSGDWVELPENKAKEISPPRKSNIVQGRFLTDIAFQHSGLLPGEYVGRRYWRDKCRVEESQGGSFMISKLEQTKETESSSAGSAGMVRKRSSRSEDQMKIRDWASFLEALKKLWEMGLDLKLDLLYDTSVHEIVSLPLYPFEMERHWYTNTNMNVGTDDA